MTECTSQGASPSTRCFRRGHNSLLHNFPSTHTGPATLNSRIALGTAIPFVPPRVGARFSPQRRGGGERVRTDDLRLAKPALSQLSYTPVLTPEMVGQGGFEPPTSRLSSARSNQLSY